jgi:maleylpyruvate isomerase
VTAVFYGYWRSGAAYRLRIALNLKGVVYENSGIDLRTGAQRSPAFLALNPQGMVPALEIDGLVLTQSPAIMEWLEETHPNPPLLPSTPQDRARVRAMAALIGCDIHPLNNLRVLGAIRSRFGADQAAVDDWAGNWIGAGFTALEALVARDSAGWCFGDSPTLADAYLIPQLYSARRFNVSLESFPHLLAVERKALEHEAFARAHPDRQPDADG